MAWRARDATDGDAAATLGLPAPALRRWLGV